MKKYIYLLMLCALAGTTWSKPVKTDEVEAELIPEMTSIQPGKPFWTAIRLKMAHEWHSYWKNAGDAGAPTRIMKWTLPEGFKAGPIHWPYPERIEWDELVNFGYHGEILLPIEITPPADLQPGGEVKLVAEASWLVCKDICLMQGGDLDLTLPVKAGAPQPDARWTKAFKSTRDTLPVKDIGWTFNGYLGEETITVHATPAKDAPATIEFSSFFPDQEEAIQNVATQTWTKQENTFVLTLQRNIHSEKIPDKISGVLVSKSGWQGKGSAKAMRFEAALGKDAPPAIVASTPSSSVADPFERRPLSRFLLFAFLGGIILNLMPCVFPVLSIKVMGFVQQAHEENTKPWQHGAVFTLGVLVSFWILAGVLVALRAGGEKIGWGFQLQSPTILILLCSLFFLFGLSLFGVFEIGTSLTGAGSKLSSKSSWAGSFFSGFLATIVATPCTAPFMGVALGFALVQPFYVSFLIFTMIALGMATPFMLLTCIPVLGRVVPRPGPWMESLKQFMGFLMMATTIWLIWVLMRRVGEDIVVPVLTLFVLLGFGGWVLGRWGALHRKTPVRWAARIIALALVAGSIYKGIAIAEELSATATTKTVSTDPKKGWEPFSPEKVAALRAEGKPVFVNFTAAWCLTCQVNKKFLHAEDVAARFEELGITTMLADWTNKDETISNTLASFKREGVPFYVLYPGGADSEPITLPEILTKKIIMDGLDKL